MRRRPAAAPASAPGRRRPAARVERAPAEEGDPPISPEEAVRKYKAGELVVAADFPVGAFQKGDWIQSGEANYGGEVCHIAGKLVKVVVEGGSAEAILAATGTKSEALLKFLSGQPGLQLRAHLCGRACDQLRTNPDLVHLKRFQLLNPGGAKTWEENLLGSGELDVLRREMERAPGKVGADRAPGEEISDTSESGKKKKKKKKKAKEKRDKKKLGGKSNARKTLKTLFEYTGLDPDVKQRRKLVAHIKRKLKKSKDTSSSDSSSLETMEETTMDEDLLQDRSKIQKVADLAPGVLGAAAIQTMKTYVMQSTGDPWHLEESSLPPVATHYARHHLLPKSSGGMKREIETLVTVADYLLMGRVAEATDIVLQRVKALEMTLQGQGWATSQKLEIIPNVDAGVASRAELQLAQREAALDVKSKGGWQSWGKEKGKGKSKDKEGTQGKGKNKGKAKEEGKKSS